MPSSDDANTERRHPITGCGGEEEAGGTAPAERLGRIDRRRSMWMSAGVAGVAHR